MCRGLMTSAVIRGAQTTPRSGPSSTQRMSETMPMMSPSADRTVRPRRSLAFMTAARDPRDHMVPCPRLEGLQVEFVSGCVAVDLLGDVADEPEVDARFVAARCQAATEGGEPTTESTADPVAE